MQSVAERFSRLYAAFNARDVDAVLAEVAPDVDWENGITGGRVHGHAAVRAYWAEQWRAIDPRVDPMRVTEDGPDRVVVDVHQVVRDHAGTLLVDQAVRHVYRLRDGLVVRMDIVPAEG